MTCSGCGNKDAHRISYSAKGESCNSCGASNNFKFSDVYFKGPGIEPNLADPNKTQMGTMIYSREHKARVMKELGVKESGDRVHGARGSGLAR